MIKVNLKKNIKNKNNFYIYTSDMLLLCSLYTCTTIVVLEFI